MATESNETLSDQHPDWQAAHFKEYPFGDDNFLVALKLKSDPTKIVYGVLGMREDKFMSHMTDLLSNATRRSLGMPEIDTSKTTHMFVDIPLRDFTPKGDLFDEAFEAANGWTEVDEKAYREFAMGLNLRPLLALLNRETAETSPRNVPYWFYETFGVNHAQLLNDILVTSYGNFNVNLEYSDKQPADAPEETPIQKALRLVDVSQKAIPQMEIKPVPIKDYLNILYASLQFLPRDWTQDGQQQ